MTTALGTRGRSRPADVAGQTQAFLALTPVLPDEQDALREHLRSWDQDDSPFARVPGTHVARLLVVDDLHHDPAYRQRRPDHLDLPRLVLSSCVDGDAVAWLERFCVALAQEAPAVWGRCVGGPRTSDPAALQAYLLHNRVHTGLFFAAYAQATVPQVRHALARREQLVAFAVRAQGLAPEDLRTAFLADLGSRA